jgi:hypothetical protein
VSLSEGVVVGVVHRVDSLQREFVGDITLSGILDFSTGGVDDVSQVEVGSAIRTLAVDGVQRGEE